MLVESDPYFPIYPKVSLIYKSCLALCAGILASLPLINIDISLHAPALIRPATEVHTIRNTANGRIKEWYLTENRRVFRGEPMYVIDASTIDEQVRNINNLIAEQARFIDDLQTALRAPCDTTSATAHITIKPKFLTTYYQQNYSQFNQRLMEAKNRLIKTRLNFERQEKLFRQQIIPPADFENHLYDFNAAKDNYALVVETQFTEWENEFKLRSIEKRDLESQLARLSAELSMLTIKAPVSGTAQEVSNIYRGSLVSAGQDVGQISPDTTLIAVAYVSPDDIGLIQLGMEVQFQVNAFNYNQWGIVVGSVLELPQDIKIQKQVPVFEVRCKLNRDFLQLKSGYKGFLKKGMSSQAHFIVTKRSLWDLLYDKVDDWINPTRIDLVTR